MIAEDGMHFAKVPRKERLSARHKALVDHYLTDAYFNKTRAGIMVGLKNPHSIVSEILERPPVKKYLQQQLDALHATKEESLIDLARMSRGGMQYFFNPTKKQFDFSTPQAIENIDLIKSISIETETRIDKDGNEIVKEKIKVDVVDKLAARTVLARVQGLLSSDVNNQTVVNQTLNLNSIAQIADDAKVNVNEIFAELPNVIRMLESQTGQTIDADVLRALVPNVANVAESKNAQENAHENEIVDALDSATSDSAPNVIDSSAHMVPASADAQNDAPGVA